MNTKIIKFAGIAFLTLILSGCGDDFLVQEPIEFINADQLADAIVKNPDVGAGSITGIYATMFTTETGGTDSQQDFGQKGYDIYMDMLSSDMALSSSVYGWYRARITELQAPVDFTQLENYQPWRYYYRVINQANLVIESLGGNDIEPEDEETQHVLGQALAMRAHSYFYLTQLFIHDVTASWSSPTLPIYTAPGLIGNAKSTTLDVYTLMEDDLTRAIGYLDGFNRPSKTQVNKPVAQAILAYVLASRRDRWQEVVTLTNEAMANSGATLMGNDNSINGILGGFNDVGSNGWIWGVDLNDDIGLSLVSWWGQMDYFSYSYAALGDNKVMDVDLYESMDADDVRRDQFYNVEGDNYLQPLFKFYDADRVHFGASQIVKADYIYMRYAELLLLNIEALARSGQEGPAQIALADFVAARGVDATYVSGLNGQALYDEIHKQTRLELWGEGKSYLAMKRNKATIKRGPNHLSYVGVEMAFDDDRLTFKIPQQEIQDNNLINDQN
ncbi:RagB/SusD family nutrient uptake outer membrane protein [Gelidibacter maritimus]|uniref:RagB/SusD family nutrient uptake outer membrane protein n=1 Tax=Gelidibacter maritimus TaxID=2761487 RepID=A0A7W2R4P4_9FLAO|nr:RagB/SusD family nutrient uptake outer membrane protein [Gelidibacter maritimus]MBA6154049.1 RagB/SusD family nutrient uptake outer membrane protein [Gelidibacter maritimus]